MKIPFILSALVFFTTQTALSQLNLKIHVVDTITKLPIPFASIRFVDSNIGTYTNDLGFFNRPTENKIQLTCLGYFLKVVELEKIKDTIFLKPQIYTLPMTVVSSGKKEIKLGYFNQRVEMNIAQRPGTELAVYIPNNQNRAILVKSILVKSIVLRVSNRQRGDLKELFNFVSVFKVNVYESGSHNTVGKTIMQKELIFTSDILQSKTIIDISNLNITAPKEGLFIGIEWVGKFNVDTHELDVNNDKSIEPFIGTTFKNLNSVVYERSLLSNNSWIIVNNKHWASKLHKKDNGFTPCISIVGY